MFSGVGRVVGSVIGIVIGGNNEIAIEEVALEVVLSVVSLLVVGSRGSSRSILHWVIARSMGSHR